jgi:hypothetical protein
MTDTETIHLSGQVDHEVAVLARIASRLGALSWAATASAEEIEAWARNQGYVLPWHKVRQLSTLLRMAASLKEGRCD